MINSKKKASYYIYLNSDRCLPFPDLDKIGQQLIPLFDINEETNINIQNF